MGFWIRTAEEKAKRGRKKFAAGNRFYNADGSRLSLKEAQETRGNDRVSLWLAAGKAKADAGKAREEARWERVKAEKAAKKARKGE